MRLPIIIIGAIILCILALGIVCILHPYIIESNQYNMIPTITVNGTNSNIGSVIAPTMNPVNSNNGTIYFGITYGKGKFFNDAKVSLYKRLSYNETIHSYDLSFINIPGNPLLSANAEQFGDTYYKFENLPYGDYSIIAERKNNTWERYWTISDRDSCVSFSIIADDPDVKIPSNIHLSNHTIYGWTRNGYGDYIPDVNVTLSKLNGGLATEINNNPQRSRDAPYTGFFYFDGVPTGWYDITVEKNGVSAHGIIEFKADNDTGFKLEPSIDIYS